MTQKKTIKHWQITLAIYVVAIAVSSGIVYFQRKDDVGIVLAGTGDNVKGFAWSENFGWISFNSMDCDVDGDGFFEGNGEAGGSAPTGCPTSGTAFDYGVKMDPATGAFSGYAWSEYADYINFSPTGPYPENPQISAGYNSGTGAVTGWAKVELLGDNGWIKMSGSWSNGVLINGLGDFSGWAWNGNGSGGIVDQSAGGAGWISFNSKDCDMDSNNKIDIACGSDNASVAVNAYKVYADLTPKAPIIGVIDEIQDSCRQVQINWTDDPDNNETGYEVEASTSPMTVGGGTQICNTVEDIINCRVNLLPSTAYYFRVRAVNSFGVSNWSPDNAGTLKSTGFCPATLTEVPSYNCTGVQLNWSQSGVGVDHYEVWRDKDSADFVLLQNPISSSATSTVDNDIAKGSKYQYKVVAQPGDETSIITDIITPCPIMQKWIETKSR